MLTPRQRDLLTFITGYIEANGGVSPSFAEMQAALGLKSRSGIAMLITLLGERGFIEHSRHGKRALKVLRSDDPIADVARAVKRLQQECGPILAAQALTAMARDMLGEV